jgi:hypothetical protein
MLDILEDYMVLRDYTFLRLDGSVSRAKRDMVIRMVGLAHLLAGIIGTDGCDLFSSSATIRVSVFSPTPWWMLLMRKSEHQVFLISTKAGGLGTFHASFPRRVVLIETHS